MKAALEKVLPDVTVELIKSSGGAFEIRHEGKLVYSKLETGRFPAHDVIISAIQS